MRVYHGVLHNLLDEIFSSANKSESREMDSIQSATRFSRALSTDFARSTVVNLVSARRRGATCQCNTGNLHTRAINRI